jgi:DNA-binding GntR family transcriptional regulator
MMFNDPLSPARNVDLRQIVYEKIKEAIVEGHIPPGERLSEVELADRIAVSRTPVREAIRQLAQTGLITLVPRRGAFVTLPTAKDASDLYDLRTALEVMAIEHACKNPPVEELEKFLDRFSHFSDEGDPALFLAEDRKFHALLRDSTGNRFLNLTLDNVADLIHLCRHYSIEDIRLSATCSEHVEVITALLAKDCPKAMAAMKRHLDNSRQALLNFINKHPELRAQLEE